MVKIVVSGGAVIVERGDPYVSHDEISSCFCQLPHSNVCCYYHGGALNEIYPRDLNHFGTEQP